MRGMKQKRVIAQTEVAMKVMENRICRIVFFVWDCIVRVHHPTKKFTDQTGFVLERPYGTQRKRGLAIKLLQRRI
jgi:hypothetical protein